MPLHHILFPKINDKIENTNRQAVVTFVWHIHIVLAKKVNNVRLYRANTQKTQDGSNWIDDVTDDKQQMAAVSSP